MKNRTSKNWNLSKNSKSALRDNIKERPKEDQVQYDLERVIDDWVLMGFLVGNDFVPHLPNMHIKQDHLPLIYQSYSKVVANQGDYLTHRGKINLAVFEALLKALRQGEKTVLLTTFSSQNKGHIFDPKNGHLFESSRHFFCKAAI